MNKVYLGDQYQYKITDQFYNRNYIRTCTKSCYSYVTHNFAITRVQPGHERVPGGDVPRVLQRGVVAGEVPQGSQLHRGLQRQGRLGQADQVGVGVFSDFVFGLNVQVVDGNIDEAIRKKFMTTLCYL